MCAPFFRAAQHTIQSPFAQITITLSLFKVRHKACERLGSLDQTIWFRFTGLTVEDGEKQNPLLPTVWRVVRITAIPCTKNGVSIDEPIWFSVYFYWDVITRTGQDGAALTNGNALVRMAHKRIKEYLVTHRYPSYSEEYDPLVLEIW